MDLTQKDPEEDPTATSHPARINTPFSTASTSSDDRIIRVVDLIDLTTDSEEPPGPSFREPSRKRRNVTYSMRIVAPETEQNNGKSDILLL